MIRSNVDLPEPFLPVSKRASPEISSKSRLVKINLSPRLAAKFNPDQVDKDRSSMVCLLPRKIEAGEPHYASLKHHKNNMVIALYFSINYLVIVLIVALSSIDRPLCN